MRYRLIIMGTVLKLLAVLFIVGGIWVWVSGRSVTDDMQAPVASVNLSASAVLAENAAHGAFDEEGTIVLDATQGTNGTPFLLYTEYTADGKPSIRTKRLVFANADECTRLNLPCATNQGGSPVGADEKVRVVGTVSDEMVEVAEVYRL